MTATTATPPPGSVAGVSRTVVSNGYLAYVIGKMFGGLLGAAALAVADTVIGGVVLAVMFANDNDGKWGDVIAWALSLGTSAALLAIWWSIFTRRKVAWLLLLPGVFVTVVDAAIDGRFATLQMMDSAAVMNTGLYPQAASFAWWLGEALIVGVTFFSEGIIMLIFMWLFAEANALGRRPAVDKSA
jgi:hypothetical protein